LFGNQSLNAIQATQSIAKLHFICLGSDASLLINTK
jgi:hypothetical protein